MRLKTIEVRNVFTYLNRVMLNGKFVLKAGESNKNRLFNILLLF